MNPKLTFQEGPHVKEWENIAESRAFNAAAEAALLKLQLDMGGEYEFNTSAVNYAKLAGARDLIRILSSLHLKAEPVPQTVLKTNLRHDI